MHREQRRPARRGLALWAGIRGRLLRTYLLLTLMTMVALTTLALIGIDWYYRSAMIDVLQARGTASQQFLARIEPGVDLALAGQDLAQELGADVPARVQLYRTDGRLVGDSSLAGPPGPMAPGPAPAEGPPGAPVPTEVLAVLRGSRQEQVVGRTTDGQRALHLALPLTGEGGQILGALRLSTSLAAVDSLLARAGFSFGGITVLILLMTAGAGLLLARTVVQPVAELTRVAEAMAHGKLGLRARVHYPDEVGRLAETLNHMAESLGELDRLRSEFLRAVSHDLRTPLTAAKAWAIALQDEGVAPEELHRGLVAIEQSSDTLARLIDDLLVAARLQAGMTIDLRPQRLDAWAACDAVCQAQAARARGAGVLLQPPVRRSLPVIFFDPDRLAQVISNLVENAIKFTPQGGRVEVELSAASPFVLLIVADTGAGIAAADLPRLTTRFFRGRNAGGIPGTGLGLAIVAELLDRSGGRLDITSAPGKGTRVTAHLPIAGGDPS